MKTTLHYISQGATPQDHLNNIHSACAAGAELVQLRLKKCDSKTILETAKKAREITSHFQTRLIINDHYKVAAEVKADGVHLGKKDACPTVARKALASWQIIGGTANTLQDCQTLIDKGVDYIGLGPFRFTETKDNLSPVLGEKGYAEIISALNTNTPIIAIGGITLNDVLDLMITGVFGIAVSGDITRDFNKITKFKELINGGTAPEQRWKPE
ncbi:thiamine phosphate synthase [Algibacter pectinivorans]|uniref:Thiamine-phosphate synthase n=1 Tax=Algibacter pectinivorans TaxID=870482 RepID=A0A1I1MMS0_9FLAO|nr:thiamine phosphate synthase [Algibacter pectinivorans]SFC86681.1 thiamine-phosphate pyrophosphorylase [Algibacter pectinivorans]